MLKFRLGVSSRLGFFLCGFHATLTRFSEWIGFFGWCEFIRAVVELIRVFDAIWFHSNPVWIFKIPFSFRVFESRELFALIRFSSDLILGFPRNPCRSFLSLLHTLSHLSQYSFLKTELGFLSYFLKIIVSRLGLKNVNFYSDIIESVELSELM